MKKFLAMILAILMLLSMVACGAKEESAKEAAAEETNYAEADVYELAKQLKEPIELTMWSTRGPDDKLGARWIACFEEYCASFPDGMVKPNYITVANSNYQEIYEKIPVAAAAGELPNLMITEDASVLQYKDILLNLNDYVSDATIQNVNVGLMKSCTDLDGARYGVPIGRSAVGMYVNMDILNKYGIDASELETWAGFEKAIEKIYTESNGETYGWVLNLDWDCWYWESAIYSGGGQFLTDDGSKATFGKDYDYIGVNWLKVVQNAFANGSVLNCYDMQDPDTELERAFFEGRAAIMFNSTSMVQTCIDNSEFEVKAMLQPAEEGCEPSIASGGACLVVADNTEDDIIRKIGAGFIEHMLQDKWVVDFAQHKPYFVTTYSALEDPAIKEVTDANPNWEAVYNMADSIHKRANSPYWTEIVAYMNDEIRIWVADDAKGDVYELVDKLEARVNEIIEENS